MDSKSYFKSIGFSTLTEVQERIIGIPGDRNVIVLSPCASGKTEAAHSMLIEWNGKGIFVLPQRTLATGIRDRLNGYHKGLGLPPFSLQHSASMEDTFLSSYYSVTTIDQILSGWLGFGRQSFIRGKNVITSNMVFDEVQLLEPDKTLLTTINLLDSMAGNGRHFMIMTATMPKTLIDFLSRRYNMEVVICDKELVHDRKVTLGWMDNHDFDLLNNFTGKQIVICNTQREQELVYEGIKDKSRCIILNSKFVRDDREAIEKEAIKYFGKGSPESNKILISTQILEAGMDISADRVYSAPCPIDSLIQRCGRCSRWGGQGFFMVFVTCNDRVYDRELVDSTVNLIKKNNGIDFTWEVQKIWTDIILGAYYYGKVNNISVEKNRRLLSAAGRGKLIRGINNVNLVIGSPSDKSFGRQPVSISINNMFQIGRSNKLWVRENGKIVQANAGTLDTGDIVVSEGYGCMYDNLGFRFVGGGVYCADFTKQVSINQNPSYDYKEETWLAHAEKVRDIAGKKLEAYYYSEWIKNNRERIAFIMGLHDIGKLDEVWQGPLWADSHGIPLAHFPIKRGASGNLFRDRHHYSIGAYALKELCSRLELSIILQHHKRLNPVQGYEKIWEYRISRQYKDILRQYGLDEDIQWEGRLLTMDCSSFIRPGEQEWNEFLFLVGIMMESDLEAIDKEIKEEKKDC